MRNLASIDLNLLVALDSLLAERSVTHAGARIGLGQSAMSKLLARLRALFADPLLLRTADGMMPTARALALVEPLRRALAEVRRVVDLEAIFEPATAARPVTLASSDLTELLLLPSFVARLRALAPGIDLRVRGADRLDVIAALQAGEVDLALMPLAANTSDLRSVVLYRDELVCVAARGHEAVRKGLTLKRFAACPHILVSVEGRGTAPVETALAARGLRRRVGLSVQHFMPVPFLVAASDMIATVPARLARTMAGMARVEILKLPLSVEGYTMHLVWHRRHDADPLMRWLRERLLDQADDRLADPAGSNLRRPAPVPRPARRPAGARAGPRRRNRRSAPGTGGTS